MTASLRLRKDPFLVALTATPSSPSMSSSESSSSSSRYLSSGRVMKLSLMLCLILPAMVIFLSSSSSAQTLLRTDTPNFIPCELAELTLGLTQAQGIKIPGVRYVPCTVFRGVRYLSSHYKRGMKMLMKSNRKSLARNKFLNSLGSKTQKNAHVSATAMATKVAANVAANVAQALVSKIKFKKQIK